MINKAISNQTHINPVETCFGREAQIQYYILFCFLFSNYMLQFCLFISIVRL